MFIGGVSLLALEHDFLANNISTFQVLAKRRRTRTNRFRERVLFIVRTLRDKNDRLCDLVIRFPGYRSRGLGLDSRYYQIFGELVGLERGRLSITEEPLIGEVAAPVWKPRLTAVGIRCTDHAILSIRKSCY
jgi:hypothetical protein